MPDRERPRKLRVVRSGVFSGSGSSLLDAMARQIRIDDVDVATYRRDPRVMKGRLLSLVESVGGRTAPISKTAAWSSHMQQALTRDGRLDDGCPTFFIQSSHAFELPRSVRYAIYTDRVGREGAAVGGAYRSRFTPSWLRREHQFLRGASFVFVMGPSTKGVLTAEYGLDPSRVVVVGAGPNTPIGAATKSTRLKRILFVGTQWDLKGGPELLEAFASARRVVHDLELVVVGSEPDIAPPTGVTFAGRLSPAAVSRAYCSADTLVIPTHMEAFGISIVEALLHGLPCIGTTVGNQSWLIGDAGVLVPPGDVDALTEALVAVAEDYGRLRVAALERKRVLEQVMNWQVVADKVLAGLLDDAVAPDIDLP